MADVETRAREAGGAVRGEARVRAHRLQPPTTRGRTPLRASGPVLVLLLVVAVVVAATMAEGWMRGGPVVEPAAPGAAGELLEIPEPGSALPSYLADGTPVFVSQPEEGEVLVLDAVSPHQRNKLIVLCSTDGSLARDRSFVDLHHGASFTRWGDYLGGPSPTGLPLHPARRVHTDDGSRMRVIGDPMPAPQREETRGPEQYHAGPACLEETDPDDVRAHRPPGDVPTLGASQVPADRWVWARLYLGEVEGRTVVCDADGACPASAPRAGPNMDGVVTFLEGDDQPLVWLARARSEGSVELLRPAIPIDASAPGPS